MSDKSKIPTSLELPFDCASVVVVENFAKRERAVLCVRTGLLAASHLLVQRFGVCLALILLVLVPSCT